MVPRSGLPHALLHLVGPHGHYRKRRDALAPGLHAVEDQGQVPAPDAGSGGVPEVRRLGQHEDDERDVGLLNVGPQLPGRLSPLYQPGDQGMVMRVFEIVTTGAPYYIVAMDKDAPDATRVAFTEGEIEPDV